MALGAGVVAGPLVAACADPPEESEPVETATTVAPPETTTTTVVATSSSTTPPTLPPAPLSSIVLDESGIGGALFGDDPDRVIAFVGSLLGAATADTGWVAADPASLCPGTEYRRVEWGVFRLEFGDLSPFAEGRRHFTGWDYGTEGVLGQEPQGLITEFGITVGSRVDELLDAYPEAQIFPGEEGTFSPSFYVDEYFDGFLTGTEPGDVVMVMFGGSRCGE